MTNTDDNKGPLDGLNVIDFGWYYAGAMTGMLLADQGANVVRIVKPGDKELPDQQYRLLNRNKKLLTLDLKTEEGKEQALSLIERADVLIENFRPGVMKRLGLDYASVKEGNPGLIYLSLPGFASTDKERAHIQAWEGIVSAASGVYTEVHMSRQLLAFPPVYISSPLCSAYGAMHGVISILAALNARGRLGAGTVIEAPLVDAGLSAFSVNFIVQRGLVIPQLRSSGRDVLEPPELLKPFIFSPQENLQSQITKLESAQDVCMSTLFQFYPCKDNRSIMLWSGVPEHAKGVLKAMGIYEALLERGVVFGDQWEPGINNFANGLGPEHTEWLRQKITETFLTKTAAEWESELAELGPVVMPRTREEWLALAPLERCPV